MQSLACEQFEAFVAREKPVLVDVRTPEEFAHGALEGALNIPLALLPLHYEELDAQRTILVYCQHGVRSGQAAQFLDGKGFAKIWHLAGGMSELRGED